MRAKQKLSHDKAKSDSLFVLHATSCLKRIREQYQVQWSKKADYNEKGRLLGSRLVYKTVFYSTPGLIFFFIKKTLNSSGFSWWPWFLHPWYATGGSETENAIPSNYFNTPKKSALLDFTCYTSNSRFKTAPTKGSHVSLHQVKNTKKVNNTRCTFSR